MTEIRIRTDTDVWKWTSQAGLEEVDSLNLLQLVQNTRQQVIQCLQALLEKGGSAAECQSAASAIGTLTELGRRVHWENPATNDTLLPKCGNPSSSQ
jgi:hypothetical protein